MVDFHSDTAVIIADQMINFNHIFIDSPVYARRACAYIVLTTRARA